MNKAHFQQTIDQMTKENEQKLFEAEEKAQTSAQKLKQGDEELADLRAERDDIKSRFDVSFGCRDCW